MLNEKNLVITKFFGYTVERERLDFWLHLYFQLNTSEVNVQWM